MSRESSTSQARSSQGKIATGEEHNCERGIGRPDRFSFVVPRRSRQSRRSHILDETVKIRRINVNLFVKKKLVDSLTEDKTSEGLYKFRFENN